MPTCTHKNNCNFESDKMKAYSKQAKKMLPSLIEGIKLWLDYVDNVAEIENACTNKHFDELHKITFNLSEIIVTSIINIGESLRKIIDASEEFTKKDFNKKESDGN